MIACPTPVARAGRAPVTEGNVTDYDVIREELRRLAERYQLREIAYDRWNATQIVTQLHRRGVTMVATGQGTRSLGAPTGELERLVLEGALVHGGHPVLRWMVGNTATDEDPTASVRPRKHKSRERIDGVVALVMAIDRVMRHTCGGDGESAYADGHGLVTV